MRAMGLLLARYGYNKVTIKDIAREAGISRPTLYLHFPNKEEIALSSADKIYGDAELYMERIAMSDLPVSEKISQMLEARVMDIFDAVIDYREGLLELFAAIREPFHEHRLAAVERETAILAGVLTQGMHTGELGLPDTPENTARALLSATAGFLPLSLSPAQLGKRDDLLIRLKTVIRILVNGLQAM